MQKSKNMKIQYLYIFAFIIVLFTKNNTAFSQELYSLQLENNKTDTLKVHNIVQYSSIQLKINSKNDSLQNKMHSVIINGFESAYKYSEFLKIIDVKQSIELPNINRTNILDPVNYIISNCYITVSILDTEGNIIFFSKIVVIFIL